MEYFVWGNQNWVGPFFGEQNILSQHTWSSQERLLPNQI